MKYGKYLDSKKRPEWGEFYIDYKGLKDLIKACAAEAETGETHFSPRTTSLTVQRYNYKKDSAEERFFTKLEAEVRQRAQVAATAWVSVVLPLCHCLSSISRLAQRAMQCHSACEPFVGMFMVTRYGSIQVDKVSKFTSRLVGDLRAALAKLNTKVEKETSQQSKAALLQVITK